MSELTDQLPSGLTDSFSQAFRSGVAHLLRAGEYANDAGVDVWQFAVEVDRLTGCGVTISDLRWLVAKGFAIHRHEKTASTGGQRLFEPRDGLGFSRESAMVLTADGAAFAQSFQSSDVPDQRPDSEIAQPSESSGVSVKPVWTSSRRELLVMGLVVKTFRVPARNQELILAAFQEERWPACILDPLPPTESITSAKRMQNAICRLNGKQTNKLVRFSANGNGTGICWELLTDPASNMTQ